MQVQTFNGLRATGTVRLQHRLMRFYANSAEWIHTWAIAALMATAVTLFRHMFTNMRGC